MLHILWIILKIIGMLVLLVLGLALLLIFIVLFVPLRYRIDGKCEGTPESLELNVRFSWLLHLIAGHYTFRNRKSDWQIRVAWKHMHAGETAGESNAVDIQNKEKQEGDQEAEQKSFPQKGRKAEQEPCRKKGQEAEQEPCRKKERETEQEFSQKKEEQKELRKKPKKTKRKKRKGISDQITAFFQKIKYTFAEICDKIKLLTEKKEKLAEFIEHEIHRNAFTKVKEEIFRLLRFLRPKKMNGRIRYGFEDPYLTGKVLAGAGILYPFYGERLVIEPDFEEKVLEGEFQIRGHVRGFYAAVVLWNVVFHKDIRTTWQHIMAFRL